MKKIVTLVSIVLLTLLISTRFSYADPAQKSPILITSIVVVTTSSSSHYIDHTNENLIYFKSTPKLTPSSLSLDKGIAEFSLPQQRVANHHNYFFEFSIIFNDKLQQLIAFFSCDDGNTDIKKNKKP